MRAIIRLSIALTLLFVLIAHTISSHAQEDWLPPQPIPNYDDEYPPILVADQNKTVHAFYISESTDLGDSVIFYRQWTLADGWRQPIDILLSPSGKAGSVAATLDQNGIFHLVIFSGQPGIQGGVYYTTAPAISAHEPRSWSEPVLLDGKAGPLTDMAIAHDGSNHLSVVYAGTSNGIGVYEVESKDLGNTWSRPSIVYLTYPEEQVLGAMQVIYDSMGHLHTVWTQWNETGTGEAIFYARKDANTGQWQGAVSLAKKDGDDFGTYYGTIVEHNGELIVLYLDGPPAPAQHMRRSFDSGETWTPQTRLFPQEGGGGAAVLLHDGDGELHIILAERIDGLGIAGMWHGVWLGERFSELEMINVRTTYEEVTSASRPRAVFSQGNVLLTVWWHDGVNIPAGFSYKVMNKPELPLVPLANPTNHLNQILSVTAVAELATPTAESQRNLTDWSDVKTDRANDPNSAETLLLGSLPVIVIILLLVIGVRIRHINRT